MAAWVKRGMVAGKHWVFSWPEGSETKQVSFYYTGTVLTMAEVFYDR